jgi:DNA replication and repair protein RecF
VHLTRLALTDFRSYAAADVRLEPGVTTFTGANGQGKTNLVEAACYAATFASHRVAADAPLIRHGAERAIIRAAITGGGRDSLLEIEVNAGRANRVRLNRAPVPRPRDALGTLRCVLFAPEDLAMVKGDPDQRRRYLDDLLVATRPRYAGVRADYERVIRQRSALLKSAKGIRGGAGQGGPSQAGPNQASTVPRGLEIWDDKLVEAGTELTAGRLELIELIRPLAAAAYSTVSGSASDSAMHYRQAFQQNQEDPQPDREKLALAMRNAIADHRRAELERGVCLVGPHRDELELSIGGLPARGYASHGESWSMALALRLAAFEVLRAGGEDPVLILDDVFAELDAGRRDRLAALAAGADQVLVTAAVGADVPAELSGRRFTVAGGAISDA